MKEASKHVTTTATLARAAFGACLHGLKKKGKAELKIRHLNGTPREGELLIDSSDRLPKIGQTFSSVVCKGVPRSPPRPIPDKDGIAFISLQLPSGRTFQSIG